MQQPLDTIGQRQRADGSFGNVHTTAIAIQVGFFMFLLLSPISNDSSFLSLLYHRIWSNCTKNYEQICK